MAKFYISYTAYDRDLAERLECLLASRGHKAFVDQGATVAGATWAETIRNEIDAADAFVILASGASVGGDFALGAEVGAAWERRKRIVAVETSDTGVSLPLPRTDYKIVRASGLSDTQLVDAILESANAAAPSPAS